MTRYRQDPLRIKRSEFDEWVKRFRFEEGLRDMGMRQFVKGGRERAKKLCHL